MTLRKWEYKGERKHFRGRYIYPGDILENEYRPSVDFELVGKVEDKEGLLRKELKQKKMKELRVIGDKYNVKDNDKSELIEEIIKEKKQRGEI